MVVDREWKHPGEKLHGVKRRQEQHLVRESLKLDRNQVRRDFLRFIRSRFGSLVASQGGEFTGPSRLLGA